MQDDLEYNIGHELSHVLYGSLNLDRFLQRCVDLLSKHMPVAGISVFSYDLKTKALTLLTEVVNGHAHICRPFLFLSDDIANGYADVQYLAQSPDKHDLVQYMDMESSASLHKVQKIARGAITSNLRLHLHFEDDVYYVATIYAFGENRYTEAHLQMASLIRQPLAYAVAQGVQNKTLMHMPSIGSGSKYTQTHMEAFLTHPLPGMRHAIDLARRAALAEVPVLILGETGVGKELIANAIQLLSSRADKPFVKVNCGAIPENLIDSELFGHEKGAFTGALATTLGKFERAQGGVIFLDEIGELPLGLQVRLLRVLQFREIERVGGAKPIELDIRIIAATHRDLKSCVERGTFREDLWFRLNIFPIIIPPLRQRREDIEPLAQLLLEQRCREMDLAHIPRLSEETLARFMAYSWPGNVRELESSIWRSLITQQHCDVLECTPASDAALEPAAKDCEEYFLTLDELNSSHIRRVLHYTKGKIHGKGGAAEILGINPSTLRSRMEKFGL